MNEELVNNLLPNEDGLMRDGNRKSYADGDDVQCTRGSILRRGWPCSVLSLSSAKHSKDIFAEVDHGPTVMTGYVDRRSGLVSVF